MLSTKGQCRALQLEEASCASMSRYDKRAQWIQSSESKPAWLEISEEGKTDTKRD